MRRIIAGGTGFIGQYLVKQWLARGIPVSIISRSKDKVKKIFQDQVEIITWDAIANHEKNILPDQHMSHSVELILNLTGANIGAKRWSKQRKQLILDSRVDSTKMLSEFCAAMGDNSPPLFSASAIGVYGLQESPGIELPAAYTENSPIDFVSTATDFLSHVGREWEKATNRAKAHGVHVVNLRFGVVLGENGGALKQLLLPFKFGLGGRIGNGMQPFSWVQLSDIANSIEFLLKNNNISGPVNIVAPQAVNQQTFAKTLGRVLHHPTCIPMPACMLRLLFGEMGEELLLKGQHVKPQILSDADYPFQFAELEAALKDCIA